MTSNIPLIIQKCLMGLRLEVDQDIVDDVQNKLEKEFEGHNEFRGALEQIAKPMQFLTREAESKGETVNTLEAQRMANSATWLQEIAYNTLRAHPLVEQKDTRETLDKVHEQEVRQMNHDYEME